MTHQTVNFAALKEATTEILQHAGIEDGQPISEFTADLIAQLEAMKEIERAGIYFEATHANLKLAAAIAEIKETIIFENTLEGVAQKFIDEGVYDDMPPELRALLTFDDIVDSMRCDYLDFPFLDKTWVVFSEYSTIA